MIHVIKYIGIGYYYMVACHQWVHMISVTLLSLSYDEFKTVSLVGDRLGLDQ